MSTILTLLQAGAIGAIAVLAWKKLSSLTHFSIRRRQNPGGGGSILITWGTPSPSKREKRKP